MSNNFNPGFDREKTAFIELANRGEGLSPIEYIYAGNASFESVLASYLKGGMIDINMLYVTNIDATDIVTVTLEAKIATIDTAYITTIYSDNIYNKEKITTKDLFVSDDLTVGSVTSLATISFHPSIFEVAGGVASFDLGAFTVIAGITSFTDATSFSVNSPLVSINYIEGALKAGAVGIYAGSLMDINAPKIQIGDPTKLGVTTLTISMKPAISFTCNSATVNIAGSTIINLTSEADINLKSPTLNLAAEVLDINGTDVNINSSTVNITGAGNISLKAAGIISVDSPGTIPGVPVPVEGSGVLVADFAPPLPVSGELIFTLPNVVTCEGGKLVTVDYVVTLTCIV